MYLITQTVIHIYIYVCTYTCMHRHTKLYITRFIGDDESVVVV